MRPDESLKKVDDYFIIQNSCRIGIQQAIVW